MRFLLACFHLCLMGLCCVGIGEELKAGESNCMLIGPRPYFLFCLDVPCGARKDTNYKQCLSTKSTN